APMSVRSETGINRVGSTPGRHRTDERERAARTEAVLRDGVIAEIRDIDISARGIHRDVPRAVSGRYCANGNERAAGSDLIFRYRVVAMIGRIHIVPGGVDHERLGQAPRGD